MVTIKDVSRRAKVSRSTVSRIIAGNGYVSDSARQAVEQAIAELGYRPNQMARGLRSHRSNIIGVVVVDIAAPFHAQMVGGIQTRCRESEKNILVASGYADCDEETQALLELIDRSCDGLIIYLENPIGAEPKSIISKSKIPVVVIGGAECEVAQGSVRIDNFTGARDATRYLLGKGHRHIAYFAGNAEYHDTRERLRGIDAALAEAGLSRGDIYLDQGEYSETFGHAAAMRLFAATRSVTAIFCGDDDVAAGALLAAKQRGLSVPHDISIMGFDDNFHARHLTPALTTVRQPTDVAGRAAADLLLEIIEGKPLTSTDITIPAEIVVRESVRQTSAVLNAAK